nr:polysaccharide biosynthesis/export family protein [uncultured Brumimicrobium sp.]
MIKASQFTFILLILTVLSSCNTHKRMVYFQTEHTADSVDTEASSNAHFTPTLKTDDFLSVVITADDVESVIPFNYPVVGVTQSVNQGYSQGNPAKVGYLVDADGMVNLPVLGRMKLGGLSRAEATLLLENELKNYLSNPVVNIQIQNFKITVLGDVKKPGTFNIPNERITLLEAIGLSGDLDITGNRNNVLVIREDEEGTKQYRIDLTTDEVLGSPVYYLEQNDVVYVEPNRAKRSQGTFWRSSGGIFISLTSLIITTITLIVK